MNIKKLIIFLIVIVGAYVFNHYYLELSVWTFTGILLLLWVFVGFLSILGIKLYKKEKGIPQAEDSYCFPDALSSIMKKVNMRTQYEASLLSISFILIGLISMAIYTVTFIEVSGWAKFMIIFNVFWGFIFLSSFLVTTYQQYVSYLQTTKAIEEFSGSQESKELIPLSQSEELGKDEIQQIEKKNKKIQEDLKKVKGGQNKHG